MSQIKLTLYNTDNEIVQTVSLSKEEISLLLGELNGSLRQQERVPLKERMPSNYLAMLRRVRDKFREIQQQAVSGRT